MTEFIFYLVDFMIRVNWKPRRGVFLLVLV